MAILLSLGLTLAYGLIALLSPITVAAALVRWAEFATFGVFRREDLRPTTAEMIRLIHEDRGEYARRFHFQIIVIRATGLSALVLFAAVAALIVLSGLR